MSVGIWGSGSVIAYITLGKLSLLHIEPSMITFHFLNNFMG